MNQQRPNNIMLQTIVRAISIILFSFSIYLLFAGNDNPGGGFIGGLMASLAILTLYLVFDIQTIQKYFPLNYQAIIVTGLFCPVITGVIAMIKGHGFFTLVDIGFGGWTFSTSILFELGVFLVVVGAVLTIMLAIAEDDE